MLTIEPEKKQYAAKLSVGQGAVTCTRFFLETSSIKDCEEFAGITPRRNQEIIAQLIQNALTEKSAVLGNTTEFSI